MSETQNKEGPRHAIMVGGRALSGDVVDGEVRLATSSSAVVRFLPGGAIVVGGSTLGSDEIVYASVRDLLRAHLYGVSSDFRPEPGLLELFSMTALTSAERDEQRKFWAESKVADTITLGPLARPEESGDIVLRNRRGQVLRVRRDGSLSCEGGRLLRPDQVVAHLRSMFSTTP